MWCPGRHDRPRSPCEVTGVAVRRARAAEAFLKEARILGTADALERGTPRFSE